MKTRKSLNWTHTSIKTEQLYTKFVYITNNTLAFTLNMPDFTLEEIDKNMEIFRSGCKML